MDPAFVITKETLDVEEFLTDVSMHLRRREMKMLLRYIGLSGKDIDALLYDNIPRHGTERGLLTSQGTVVEGSISVNFMDQRKKSMQTWWEYAANTRQRNTPSQQKLKVVETSTCTLPQIPEDSYVEMDNVAHESADKITETTSFPPLLPAPIRKYFEGKDSLLSEDDLSSLSTSNFEKEVRRGDKVNLSQTISPSKTPRKTSRLSTANSEIAEILSIPVVQVPLIENDSDGLPTSIKTVDYKATNTNSESQPSMMDKSQQTDLIGCDLPPDQVAIFGSSVTLEELLRKLWKSLQACGLNKVVEELQQRWMIRVDINQGRADMYPKMTWGTPPPPQTPFTYPPYKRIGHMAVMGSTMSIEAKPIGYGTSEVSPRIAKFDNESVITARSLPAEPAKASNFLPSSVREYLKSRSAKSRGLSSISLDGSPVTSFPARDAWKLRTDTVRRKGATITIHVTIEDVTLPTQPSTTWGSSLNVTQQQLRERVARVFLSHVLQDSRGLCRALDRVERIRGLVVESAMKRVGGGGNGIEITNSELVLQCRCLHPETVEQLWLLYQSGQLGETMQAGLVTKRAQQICAVEFLRTRVSITEEEYRRALGLLRRKPMPNTKTGRFYVTSGTGGVVGGAAGIANAQKQALMSVTRYIKLPESTPSVQATELPGPPTTRLAHHVIGKQKAKASTEKKAKSVGNLVQRVLCKELDSMKDRLKMCEDTWCEFSANNFSNMLTCARNVMKRRIVGSTTQNQLTPRCTSLGVFLALYKAIKSRKTNGSVASPRSHHATTIGGSHSSIALYPSDIAFSNTDLVTTIHDDEDVIKARKNEEQEFTRSYAVFTNLLAELSACRIILQDRIINRLTTNPTVASSKHLYLAKDIYNLMERWRHLLARDFNFASDETVQRLSTRLFSVDSAIPVFDQEIKEQFPGIIGLIPMMFHIAEQIVFKLKELLPRTGSNTATRIYPALSTPRSGAIQSRHLSLWLSA